MDSKLKTLLDTMRSGDEAAQKRYLADLITKGQQAEDLKAFPDEARRRRKARLPGRYEIVSLYDRNH